MESTSPPIRSDRISSHAIRARWPIALALAVIGLATAGIVTALQGDQYEASASLLFRDPGFDERLFGSSVLKATDPEREAATNLRLVSLEIVAERTAEALGFAHDDPEEILDVVSVEPQGRSDLVQITARSPDPNEAARLANTFAKQYVAFRRDADRATVARARELVARDLSSLPSSERSGAEGRALQNEISQLRTLEALQTGNAEIVQAARVPSERASPKPLRNLAVGGAIGILLGVALMLVSARLDRQLRTVDELADVLGYPIVGVVPASSDLSGRKATGKLAPDVREAFRLLRARLRYFNVDRDIKSVLVCSAAPGDGKSTTAIHLAVTAATARTSTLLLDADLHHHTVAEHFGLAPIPGLSELLTDQADRDSVVHEVSVHGDQAEPRTLDVIVSGASPPNASALMESGEMKVLLTELERQFDLVVVDAPPITGLADAIPLIEQVSGVLVVAKLGSTNRDQAIALRETLEALKAPVLGVVVNHVNSRQLAYGYGYGRYYS